MMKKATTVILLLISLSLNLLSVSAQGANPEGISMEKAKEIALEQVKGKIVSANIENDDGMVKYEIIIQAKNGRYEVEIDKSTGKVLEVEKENGSRNGEDDGEDENDDHDEPNDD
jgi:hypothetical protein